MALQNPRAALLLVLSKVEVSGGGISQLPLYDTAQAEIQTLNGDSENGETIPSVSPVFLWPKKAGNTKKARALFVCFCCLKVGGLECVLKWVCVYGVCEWFVIDVIISHKSKDVWYFVVFHWTNIVQVEEYTHRLCYILLYMFDLPTRHWLCRSLEVSKSMRPIRPIWLRTIQNRLQVYTFLGMRRPPNCSCFKKPLAGVFTWVPTRGSIAICHIAKVSSRSS